MDSERYLRSLVECEEVEPHPNGQRVISHYFAAGARVCQCGGMVVVGEGEMKWDDKTVAVSPRWRDEPDTGP